MRSPIPWRRRTALLGAMIVSAGSARAQGAPLDAAAGVRPPTVAARSALPALESPDGPARHTALGATIGVALGVAAVALVVERCKGSDHGDGPPCGLFYFYYGPFAALGGGLLGGLIGHSWPDLVEGTRSRKEGRAMPRELPTR